MDDQGLCRRAAAYLVRPDSDERLPALSASDAPVLTDLGNGLRVGYVVDLGTRFQYIQRRHLRAEGVTQQELHRNSVAKLSTMLNDRSAVVHPCADCFIVVFDGHFDASLILVDVLWDEMLDDFAPNGFVAAVPSKNGLAFCDSKTPDGPLQLRRIIKHLGGDHPISTTLYCRDSTLREWRQYSI
jgi:uncharacterized protein YtpQ (UPF0354 family)